MSALQVGEVLRALDEAGDLRAGIMARFKALGGDLDRWSSRDLGAMVYAVTKGEDDAEVRQCKPSTRDRLRALRRRLEDAVDRGETSSRRAAP